MFKVGGSADNPKKRTTMSFISNLLKSGEKKKNTEDNFKDDSNVFLFDSDDESINSDAVSQTEPKKKRKTSLLKRIRNAFDKSSIIESDEEVGTQPTQALSKNTENEQHAPTQPTQLPIIEKKAMEPQSLTQPTQLKGIFDEESDIQAPSNTQPTQLKGIFDEESDIEAPSNTQPTQLKGSLENEGNMADSHPKTQETQLKKIVEDDDKTKPDTIQTQPTQLNIQQTKGELSETQPTQLKAIFDDEDDEFFENMNAPPIKDKKSTGLKAIFEESDDSLFDELPEAPGFEKSKVANLSKEDELVQLEIEANSDTDEYNSDVSDFEIELESDKEAEADLEKEEIEVKKEAPLPNKTFSQEYILLSDDEDDDEFDTIKSRHNESAETKATSMIIQAHIARQQSIKNNENLKKNKKKGMDVLDLFAQLRKKAVKQSQKTRANLEIVEKLSVEDDGGSEKEEKSDQEDLSDMDNHLNVDSDYDGDEEIDDLSSNDEVIEQQEEEIFYGKKAVANDTVPFEKAPESKEFSDPIEENTNMEKEFDFEKEKRRMERAKLRREALKKESNSNVENPFLAEEAEESDSEEEDALRNFGIKDKNKEDDEKVDDVLHTSDEEMFDDDSDIENNEEDLRQLEREQQARDEEELEKQIQKTLKGERRGIDREEGFLDDDNDFEQDDEYIAYKKRQDAMEAKISKRMNKSKKAKINVLEGVNARISLPENKIGVLDKFTVTSTLSFLARDSTLEENRIIEEKSESDDKDDNIMRKFQTKMAFSTSPFDEPKNLEDDDDQADSLMFIKNVKKIVKKPAIESEEMKFRLGVKTYTKNHTRNPHTKTITKGADRYSFNKNGKREVPFLGKKRKPESKDSVFNHDVKKHKV